MELPQVDLDQLSNLMKLMDEYDFDEIDLREEGRRLHLLRNAGGRRPQHGPSVVVTPGMTGAAAAAADPAAAPSGEAAVDEGIHVITSPMVGTFYRSPSPDAGPFIEEGQRCEENSVLCILEAMKVMNEIRADCAGEVVKVLVANGEAVEYGEPLFHVRLDG